MRRDTREKIVVPMDEVTTKLSEILETIQKDLYTKAKAFLDSHIHVATNMEEMKETAKPGCSKQCGAETTHVKR